MLAKVLISSPKWTLAAANSSNFDLSHKNAPNRPQGMSVHNSWVTSCSLLLLLFWFWLRRLNSHDIPRVTQFTEFIRSHHRRRHRHRHRRHSRPINGERGVPAEAEAVQVGQGGAGRGVAVRLTEWKLPKMWNQQQRMQNNKRRATQHGDSAANLNMKKHFLFPVPPKYVKKFGQSERCRAAAAAAADRTECCRYRCRCRVDSITSAKASGEPHSYPHPSPPSYSRTANPQHVPS